MSDHVHAQRHFYKHLCMHPGAHKSAKAFAQKIVDRDSEAIAALKDLAARAGHDESAANALRIVAVTLKFEKPTPSHPIMAGGLPQAGGKILKIALTPAAWVVSSSGKAFHWAGSQLQHLSRMI